MIGDDAAVLEDILNEILYSSGDITHALLIDRDGIPIMSKSRAGNMNVVHSQQISALCGAMFEAAQEQGVFLNLGSIEFQMTEYADGFLMAVGIDTSLFCLFTTKNIRVGNIFQLLKSYQDPLTNILGNFACVDMGEGELPDDLKALFSSEFIDL